MDTEKPNEKVDEITTYTKNKLREYEEIPGMKKLISNLKKIQDSYLSFEIGVATYAIKKPERIKAVTDFIDAAESLTTSDVVEYITNQPDFFEDCEEPFVTEDVLDGGDEAALADCRIVLRR